MDSIKSTAVPTVHGGVVTNPDGTNIGDPIPTNGNNPSYTISYDGFNNPLYIDETISGITYRTTITYTDGNITEISAAVEL